MKEVNKLYSELNDEGLGFPVGSDDQSINELSDELGELVVRAETDHEVAVYKKGDTLTLVGDENGPWAVETTGELIFPTPGGVFIE